jgi:hypothetical protein
MLGIGSDSAMIGANFRMYGPEMGIYDYEDYLRYARRIYKEAMANPEGFTIIELSEGKKAIDFQGKLRGVFTASGEPVAFFKPDYKKMGFTNYKDELEEFAASIRIAQS